MPPPPPPPPPPQLVLRYDTLLFVSITNNSNTVGCLYKAVPVAGPATMVTGAGRQFNRNRLAGGEYSPSGTRDRFDLSRHRDVRQRPVVQSRRNVLSEVFAPARDRIAKAGNVIRLRGQVGVCPLALTW